LKHALNNIQQQLYVLPQRRDEFVVAMSVNGRVESFESEVYKKDGSTIWISENARMVYDATGTFLYYEGSVHDITTRKKAEEKSYNLAFYDPLTNLPNRRLFVDRLNQALAYTMRNASHGALLFIRS
jgi:predicted signal transduction protein with EAL and GGDEF domain